MGINQLNGRGGKEKSISRVASRMFGSRVAAAVEINALLGGSGGRICSFPRQPVISGM